MELFGQLEDLTNRERNQLKPVRIALKNGIKHNQMKFNINRFISDLVSEYTLAFHPYNSAAEIGAWIHIVGLIIRVNDISVTSENSNQQILDIVEELIAAN
jgi:hypothetical protein